MKGNPASPGGSLTSRPTWSNALGVFHHVGFFLPSVMRLGRNPRESAMNESKSTMAQQTAPAAISFEQRRTGNHGPKSVTVVQSEGTLLITPHEALSPEEEALAKSPAEPLRSRSSTAGCLPTLPARSGRRLRESQAWKCARRPHRSNGSQALLCG